jgi:hypothetical protein
MSNNKPLYITLPTGYAFLCPNCLAYGHAWRSNEIEELETYFSDLGYSICFGYVSDMDAPIIGCRYKVELNKLNSITNAFCITRQL